MPSRMGEGLAAVGVTLLALALAACKSDPPASVKDAKVLTVTAELPADLDLEIQRHFESVPNSYFCKNLSEANWNWVPVVETVHSRLNGSIKRVQVPLAWAERSYCQWNLESTDIRLIARNVDGLVLALGITNRLFAEYGSGAEKQAGCVNAVEVQCVKCRDFSVPACHVTVRRADSACRQGIRRDHLQLLFNVTYSTNALMEWTDCRKINDGHYDDDHWDKWPITIEESGKFDSAEVAVDAGTNAEQEGGHPDAGAK